MFLNPVATSSVMLKKQLPNEILESIILFCEDYDLWTRIMINGNGLVIPDFLAKYRLC
ncbi:MAG: hypothetical protein IPL21_15325 [Saprospirales bacterium]|nr:hypothetical protein [Saprospirales bacterium]